VKQEDVANTPFTLCYSAFPTRYLDDYAEEISSIYDGFFFPIGSWRRGCEEKLGIDGRPPLDRGWVESARSNLASLRRAGAQENFLTVCFDKEGEWPSPATILDPSYQDKMGRYFSKIALSARRLGFRGVCIDVEYPYPRYEVEHPVYRYEDYTVGRLLAESRREGRIVAASILDQYPDVPVITLPGNLRCRPIVRSFLVGILEEMARRDSKGGLHLGSEFTYSLNDPVTNVAAVLADEGIVDFISSEEVADYWRGACTVAPGVWPLHMVETGGEGYPERPWSDELSELSDQLAILRRLSERYVWVYTGAPSWLVDPEAAPRYGISQARFEKRDVDLQEWHQVLRRRLTTDPALEELVEAVQNYRLHRIGSEELCDRFGTPASWWVLGPLGNPHTHPEFAAEESREESIDPYRPYHGRDGAVRWFVFQNNDPRGIVSCRYVFDWRRTDDASANFASFVHVQRPMDLLLNVGWDDGIRVWLNDRLVFDRAEYPPEGHGFQYRDRYCFEDRVRVRLPRGTSKLFVTSINSHGNWIFSLRLTGEDGIPPAGLQFRLDWA